MRVFKSWALLLILIAASTTVLIYVSTASSSPGNQVWSKTFGGEGDEWAFSVIETIDGGYVLAGFTNSSGAGKMDSWLIKTDSLGNHQWNKTYGGDGYDWASSVIQTNDGGYAMTGTTNSSLDGSYDFWLIKTDPWGNQEWNKTYRGINNDYASSIIQTIDGGYVLSGFKNSFGDGGYSFSGFRDVYIVGNADVWLIKTDTSGNELWNKTFGGLNDDGAFSLVQTSDGGFALTGNTYSFNAGNNTDFWFIKTDSFGNEMWNKTYGGPKDDFGYFAIQNKDGGYSLTGITNSCGYGYEDVYLIKTDASGNRVWDKTYGEPLNDEAYKVIQTNDGYILAGSKFTFEDLWDALLIKTDSSGEILWKQTYGGTGDDQVTSFIIDNERGFVLSGATTTWGAGGWDAWLIKVSSGAQSPIDNFSFTPSTFASLFLISIGTLVVVVATYFKKR